MPRPPAFHTSAIDHRVDQICDAAGLPPALGLFPLGSPIRLLARRANLAAVGGFHALMQQIAQPIVAQGVLDHSDFYTNPELRMQRTADFLHAVIYGDRDHVKLGVRRYAAGHDPVAGVISAGTCPDLAGTPYDGWEDPARVWVLATLLESMITATDILFPGALTPADKDAAWADVLRIAEVLDVRAAMPQDFPALRAWMDERLDDLRTGDVPSSPLRPNLHVHRTTRTLAHLLFTKIPDYFGISDSVAWYTTPPALRPLVPEVPQPTRKLEFDVFVAGMLAAAVVEPYSEAWREYQARTGDDA